MAQGFESPISPVVLARLVFNLTDVTGTNHVYRAEFRWRGAKFKRAKRR